MSKSASIVLICVITILILFLGVFTFYPNAIGFGEYNEYRSPMYLIQKSKSFTTSEKATYQVNLDDGTEFSTVKSILNARFAKAFGYYNVGIDYNKESNVATIVLPKPNNPDNTSATSILSSVIQKGNVEVMKSDASSYSTSSVLLGKEHFKRARTQSYASGEYTVNVCEVKLTSEGQKVAQALSSATSGTRLAIDGELSQNYTVFYNNGVLQIQSLASVDMITAYINTGVLNATLTLNDTEEVTTIGGLIFIIVMAVIVLASLLFFAIRYNTLGIVGILSQLIATVVFTICAGLIHMEMFNVFAAIGVVLVYLLMTAFSVWTFEILRKARKDNPSVFSFSKAFVNSSKAEKKGRVQMSLNAKVNLIVHASLLVLGIILWVIPTCVTAPLGNVFVYGAILSFVATFCLNRLFGALITPLMEEDTHSRNRK